eukprot:68415_1
MLSCSTSQKTNPSNRLTTPSDECRLILKRYFKHESFRENQLNIILNTIDGGDSLVVMATGSGKSLCYQIPPIISKKPAIVISPLVSLIQNQVQSLRSKGIASIGFTGALKSTQLDYEEAFENNTYSIIYLTPEGLQSKLHHLQNLNAKHGICCIAIDESHCVSEWGHDFRPCYKQLGIIRDSLPTVPVLALTATATGNVQNDVTKSLKLGQFGHSMLRVVSTFNRTNLTYHIQPKKSIDEDLCYFRCKEYYREGSTIIYTVTQKSAEKIAAALNKYGINACAYHAGLRHSQRTDIQSRWERNAIQCIVATIAFGMGIDKQDIRHVIHYGVPDSIEGYYQQTGRAGRDGKPSNCVLFWSSGDFSKADWRASNTNSKQYQDRIVKQTACMKQFVHSRSCRVKYILEYFGEQFAECDDRCDNCIRRRKEGSTGNQNRIAKDFTQQTKYLVLACFQMGQRFGISTVIAFAQGKDNKSTKKIFNRESLEAYGKLQNYTIKWIKALSRKVIEFGFLEEVWTTPYTGNNNYTSSYKLRGFKKIRVTRKGRLLMNGECTVPHWIPDNDMVQAEKEQKTSTSVSKKWRFVGKPHTTPAPTTKTKTKASSKWSFQNTDNATPTTCNSNNAGVTLECQGGKRSYSQMESGNIFRQRGEHAAKRRKMSDPPKASAPVPDIDNLKEKLIKLRKILASKKGLIAYQVLNNDGIDLLNKYRPTDMNHLEMLMNKDGTAFIQQYGSYFTQLICGHCEKSSLGGNVGLEATVLPSNPDVNANISIGIPPITTQSKQIYEAFVRGESIEDIVRKRVISRRKIEECLSNMIINGFKMDWNLLPFSEEQTEACFDVLSSVGVSAAYDAIRKHNALIGTLSDSQIDLLIARYIAQCFKRPAPRNHGKKWTIDDDDRLWRQRDECIIELARKWERTEGSLMGRLHSLRNWNHKNHSRLRNHYHQRFEFICQKEIVCNELHSIATSHGELLGSKEWNVEEDLCLWRNRDCGVELLSKHFSVKYVVITERLMDLSGADGSAKWRMQQMNTNHEDAAKDVEMSTNSKDNYAIIRKILSDSPHGVAFDQFAIALEIQSEQINDILQELMESFQVYKKNDRFFPL